MTHLKIPRLVWPLGLFVLITGVVLVLNQFTYDWSLWSPSSCLPRCFCEWPGPGFIRQPANTFSNLAYILVGLLIVGTASPGSFRSDGPNLMRRWADHRTTYGLAVVAIGAGSLFYHASLTQIGQWFDWVGMYAFASYILLYNLLRLRSFPRSIFYSAYAILNGVLFINSVINVGTRTQVFTVLIVIALALEVVVLFLRRPQVKLLWFIGALAALLAARYIWGLDVNGVFCTPSSLVQGHAIWHMLTALSTALLYRYYVSENTHPAQRTSHSAPELPRVSAP
jgi:hypothetical protein